MELRFKQGDWVEFDCCSQKQFGKILGFHFERPTRNVFWIVETKKVQSEDYPFTVLLVQDELVNENDFSQVF